jgi:hypothetical protein
MPGTIPTWFAANNNTTTANNAATLLVNPYDFTTGDYRLSNGSAASTGADFTDAFVTAGGVITPPSTSWWTCTSYIGAFPETDGMSGTTSNNWTAGWANWGSTKCFLMVVQILQLVPTLLLTLLGLQVSVCIITKQSLCY